MLKMVMSRFSVELFCLKVLENFVAELFCVVFQKTSGSKKGFWIRMGRKCHDFPPKFFCRNLPKDFIEESFGVSIL